MANLTKLLGIPYLIGKIKFKLSVHGPKWLRKYKLGFIIGMILQEGGEISNIFCMFTQILGEMIHFE